MSVFSKKWVSFAAAVCCWSMQGTHAAELLSGFGDDGVFGTLVMAPNDDGSSASLELPFDLNFFGITFSSFWVNNNGNVTFRNSLSAYTPNPFPVSNQPMIAPWWADVDTRGAGAVYVGAANPSTVVVTWNQVGYYSQHADKTNSFQLVLRDRQDTGAGNFDIEFRYKQLGWTTGDESGGVGGAGGTPAQAGYDNGLGNNYFTLPGSRTGDVLNLVNTSNVSESTPGLWSFAVRNGQTPGLVESNPLMPVVIDGSFVFDFTPQPEQIVWIDPDVATGYDFELSSSDAAQSFESLIIGTNAGDSLYDIYVWDGAQYVLVGNDVAADSEFSFADTTFAGAVRRFRVDGIEVEAGLDPNSTTAFVTGMRFTTGSAVQVSQTPLVTSVPEPQSWLLAMGGLVVLSGLRRRIAGRA